MSDRRKEEAPPIEPEIGEGEETEEVVDEDGDVDLEVIEPDVIEAPPQDDILEAAESEDEEEIPVEPRGSLIPFDPLQAYLAEARRYPLLSREEEKELAIRYVESEDVDAAYRLVTANLRLVVMVAREYARASRNLLDLVQEGNIGLMEAVKRFDPYRGVRFPSYAVWWIRAYIIRYLINNWRMVKVGTTQAQRKLFFNLQKEKDKLERQGIFPDAKLIAERLDVKEREVVEMEQRLSSRDLSVDAPSRHDEDGTLLDVLPNRATDTEQDFANAEFAAQIGSVIREFGDTLQGKEARIFEARLVANEPLTLQEIGEEFQISRERVRQIEARLKKKLKAYMLEKIGDIEDSL